MCLGDWRVGRQIQILPTVLITAGGVGQLLKPNFQRVGIRVTFQATNTIDAVSLFVRRGTTNYLIAQLSLFNPILDINLVNNGSLPVYEFRYDDSGLIQAIGIIEYTLPESVLAETEGAMTSPYKP